MKAIGFLALALSAATACAEIGGLRVVQLDLARQMETTAFVSNYIDRVAALGFDTLQLYLEGRVGTKTFSLPEGERYTAAQMSGLVAHAKEKGMTVVPVVSLLGHAEQFFMHPGCDEYLEDGGDNIRLGSGRNTFCLSNPKTREFLSAYVAELCGIFPGPYFHAGFDEAWNSGTCPRCRGKEARDELFAECVLFAHDLLARHGRRMWMWDDFFAFHPKAFAKLPKDVVLCHWNYDADVSDRGSRLNFAGRFREDALAKYARLGYDAIPCCWFRTENIRTLAAYARRNRVFGFALTQWEELIPQFHGGSYPRIVAGSLILSDPARYQVEDAFAAACRTVFPSLSETEALAAAALLHDPADALAVETLRASSLRPSQGEVARDPFAERALLDDLVMRGERALAERRVAAAERLLTDPRRTKADVAAAVKGLEGVAAACERLAKRRRAQAAVWRPGCSPCAAGGTESGLAEKARKLVSGAAVAADDERRLELEFTMVDYYGVPRWTVFGRFSGEWCELAKGAWKPRPGDWAAFTAYVTFRSAERPEALRLEHHGYGEVALRHVAVEDRSARLVPEAVESVSGNVRNAEAVLRDDYATAAFGEFDFLPAYYDRARANAISSLTVRLR